MSFFTNRIAALAGDFCDGLLSGLSSANGQQVPSIDSLCAANGWTIDERNGRSIGLHFRSPQGGMKKVFVHATDGPTTLLVAYSDAQIAFGQVPPELFAYLAKRNGELLFAAWQAYAVGEDRIGLMLAYTALTHGLTAPLFKHLCESMAAEAAELDGKLEQSGLLSF